MQRLTCCVPQAVESELALQQTEMNIVLKLDVKVTDLEAHHVANGGYQRKNEPSMQPYFSNTVGT